MKLVTTISALVFTTAFLTIAGCSQQEQVTIQKQDSTNANTLKESETSSAEDIQPDNTMGWQDTESSVDASIATTPEASVSEEPVVRMNAAKNARSSRSLESQNDGRRNLPNEPAMKMSSAMKAEESEKTSPRGIAQSRMARGGGDAKFDSADADKSRMFSQSVQPAAGNKLPANGRITNRSLTPENRQGLGNRSIEQPPKINVFDFDVQPGEELWIIAKGSSAKTQQTNANQPGSGCLMATLPDQTIQVPVPLKHTEVVGNIDGYIASVDVKQQFHNPYDQKIEARYVFPLPDDAAVNQFVMTVGERRIRGIIRKKEVAEKIYNAAKSRGHVASLLNQERPNIFTQKVANIEPGKQIDIDIRYFNTLKYDHGNYEFVFPMVVGPRFNPPATQNGIGAVARNATGTSGQSTEVSYLAPHERSGHDISVTLNINAGVDIEAINSVNHQIVTTTSNSARRKTVQLASYDTIPNKDFVLRYQVAGNQIKTALMTHEDERGKYFTMMLYPPAELTDVQRSPMEMVFVLDCSGSMRGKPLNQAKNAVRHALRSLTERDSFQIIRFSSNSSQLGSAPLQATETNIRKGLQYLDSLKGGGGTHMIEGVKAALNFPHDEGRFRLVSFMTDGYIGNEQQILTALHHQLGASRIFSFGVGSSPNRLLMNRMAVLGKGAVAYLSLNDDAVKIMDQFHQQISHPAMTDLAIDWGSMNVSDVYPKRLPDLMVGRPIVVTGRFEGQPAEVKINGRVDMEAASFSVDLDAHPTKQHSGIAAMWARLKIMDSMNELSRHPAVADQIKTSITSTALNYHLMSQYTSFVAVDSLTVTEEGTGTTVNVAVPVPEGVKYETTVSGTN